MNRLCIASFVVCVAAAVPGCGGSSPHGGTPDSAVMPPDSAPPDPYGGVAVTNQIDIPGLDGRVDVVRDSYGIIHVRAQTIADLGFAEGYLMAHDRLAQMDILRRYGEGKLAELFGDLDPSVIDSDLEMRMHRMVPLAQQSLAQLKASSSSTDQELVTLLQRFADGVNAYNDALKAGKYKLDPQVAATFDPTRFTPWTPIDTLVLGRFEAFSLSYSVPAELRLTQLYQDARKTFAQAPLPGQTGYNPALDARRLAAHDLLGITPIGQSPTIDGWPNVTVDTGTRANSGRPGHREAAHTVRRGGAVQARVTRAAAQRPTVPDSVIAKALHTLRRKLPLGPHAFTRPEAGSNTWAVDPSVGGGAAVLAGDQHLSLPNPSIFYPMQLVVPGKLDVEGITFPGVPIVILGHNADAAWSSTVAAHDVNDVYKEQIQPCSSGSGDCVLFKGKEVPIQTWTETIKIGTLGTITRSEKATYEYVPQHGPFIPDVENGKIVPRTSDVALSVKYTGYQVSQEVRAFYRLDQAKTVDDAFKALSDFSYGGQNFVIIDNKGNIGWTTYAKIPVRAPAAYTWNAVSDPQGNAPWFIFPGDGTAEWTGYMDPRYIPHAIDPKQGYLVTANSDPVGETFDGDPLNGPKVNGVPLFVGAFYAPGLRTDRITNLIKQRIKAGQPVDADANSAIQIDSNSTFGAHMKPYVVSALADLTASSPPPDVAAWMATLSPSELQRLQQAGQYLSSWTLATPAAVLGSPTAQEVSDSVATTLFNSLVHFFLQNSVGDEYAAMGWNVYDLPESLTAPVILALLEHPNTLGTGVATQTGQALLCDDMNTGSVVESCDLEILKSLDQAMNWAQTTFSTSDMSQWRWGHIHTLTLKPLFPDDKLNIPTANDPNPALRNGFPKAGDEFVINRADCGYNDLDFNQNGDGPAQRFVAWVKPGGAVNARMSLPGGTVYDRSSSHYRDLLDKYYLPQTQFDVPYTTSEVVAHGEQHWVFSSP